MKFKHYCSKADLAENLDLLRKSLETDQTDVIISRFESATTSAALPFEAVVQFQEALQQCRESPVLTASILSKAIQDYQTTANHYEKQRLTLFGLTHSETRAPEQAVTITARV